MATFGILCGGGPAPGLNGVIGAAVIAAARRGARSIGIYDGFRWLMEGDTSHVLELGPEDSRLLHLAGGSVLHTADWKLDAEPVVGPAFDAGPYQAVGQSGVDAVICDSTNAPVPGFTPAESAVATGLDAVIRGRRGRVVVACR